MNAPIITGDDWSIGRPPRLCGTVVHNKSVTAVYHAQCLDILRSFPDNHVSSIITDPPYGLADFSSGIVTNTLAAWCTGDRSYVPDGKGFMGAEWDRFVPPPVVWDECLRILKPGGHMLVFAGTRTLGLMDISLRLAGFDIRDTITWIYGSGFPKSLDISKAIDKAVGAKQEVTSVSSDGAINKPRAMSPDRLSRSATPAIIDHVTDTVQQWEGWGTGLKPGHEPIILARKSFNGSVVKNVLEHGTGGLNIDNCRMSASDTQLAEKYASVRNAPARRNTVYGTDGRARGECRAEPHSDGRWPPNLVLSHSPLLDPDGEIIGDACTNGCVGDCPIKKLDQQSGTHPVARTPSNATGSESIYRPGQGGYQKQGPLHQDSGGASRYYPTFRYQAKAPKSERPAIDGITHPTVKPLGLMKWLITLISPSGGIILDPFAGTGTLGEAAQHLGFSSILIERERKYLPHIRERLTRGLEAGKP